MKVRVNGYEVEIKARDLSRDRANKKDTLQFMNDICCLAIEAREHYEMEGYVALTEEAESFRKAFFKVCDENGLYNKQGGK